MSIDRKVWGIAVVHFTKFKTNKREIFQAIEILEYIDKQQLIAAEKWGRSKILIIDDKVFYNGKTKFEPKILVCNSSVRRVRDSVLNKKKPTSQGVCHLIGYITTIFPCSQINYSS